jgi:hypothetical protein
VFLSVGCCSAVWMATIATIEEWLMTTPSEEKEVFAV